MKQNWQYLLLEYISTTKDLPPVQRPYTCFGVNQKHILDWPPVSLNLNLIETYKQVHQYENVKTLKAAIHAS